MKETQNKSFRLGAGRTTSTSQRRDEGIKVFEPNTTSTHPRILQKGKITLNLNLNKKPFTFYARSDVVELTLIANRRQAYRKFAEQWYGQRNGG